jgi:hypothetical protein
VQAPISEENHIAAAVNPEMLLLDGTANAMLHNVVGRITNAIV